MAYNVDTYRFLCSIEYEIKWAGKYGAKGEKRAPKKKATPEQIQKQNAWKKEDMARRTMKLNFKKGDLWCTMLYPKGTRKEIRKVRKDVKKFLRKLRDGYRKLGEELKYMCRIEIGSRGGIHIHMLCNQIRGETPVDMMIQREWTAGRVHFERFGGEENDYKNLASYLVKMQDSGNLDKLDPKDRRAVSSYSTSRNLERPEPDRKKYMKWTVRKLVKEGPKPSPGYYIDTDSIRSGINPYTGMSYLYYTEVRLNPGGTGG